MITPIKAIMIQQLSSLRNDWLSRCYAQKEEQKKANAKEKVFFSADIHSMEIAIEDLDRTIKFLKGSYK